MNGWHEDIDDWHGPIDRTEIAVVWDARTQGVAEKTVDYRRCGCVVWSSR